MARVELYIYFLEFYVCVLLLNSGIYWLCGVLRWVSTRRVDLRGRSIATNLNLYFNGIS